MGDTSIQWTDKTWSPLRVRVRDDAGEIAKAKNYTSLVQIATRMQGHVGPHCEHVSDGCKYCYSGTNNGRCLPSNGTGLPFDRRSRDLVEPFVDEKILLQPLSWGDHQFRPLRIFVENQSDLFGEWVPDEAIDWVFAVMALCPQHTFQILTKRPERMAAYINGKQHGRLCDWAQKIHGGVHGNAPFPLPNVWLGVSVEDQATADQRIPLLLQTPAAKRFVSYEPALAEVDFTEYLRFESCGGGHRTRSTRLDWIIVGGESGPGARPFDVSWQSETIDQCRAAGVALFCKQQGARPGYNRVDGWHDIDLKDRKGGDMNEWPEYQRVREFPQ